MHTKQFFDLSGLILGERYVLTDKLGQGSWGTVYRARDRLTKFKKEYAVKCIWKESLTREGQKLLFREVSLHRVVSGISPHVLPLHCVLENSAFLFLVLDICSRGDMGAALHHNTFPSHDEAIRDIFLQILDGIEACHREGVYHRDIKPENVLFYEDGNACIADFGLATDEETSTEFAGTNEYLSPGESCYHLVIIGHSHTSGIRINPGHFQTSGLLSTAFRYMGTWNRAHQHGDWRTSMVNSISQ